MFGIKNLPLDGRVHDLTYPQVQIRNKRAARHLKVTLTPMTMRSSKHKQAGPCVARDTVR